MLKRNITYTDFNGDKVTEEFYFNLSRTEIITMEAAGVRALFERIVKTTDAEALVEEFKKIILLCYGVKSEDGRHFEKSDELRAKFASSAAFDELFTELSSSDGAAAIFVNGVIPKEALEELSKRVEQDKPTGPPPVPRPPLPPAS